MSHTARLTRSIPFWILIAGSLATAATGAWLVFDKMSNLTRTLTDGSATPLDVYGGQSWVTVGAVLVGAGLVGLVAALLLGAARSLVSAAPLDVIEPVAHDAQEPVVAGHIEPVAEVAAETVAPESVDAEPAEPAAPEDDSTSSR